MKAAVVPAVSSSWQIKDVPQPQPGPNQVLVKMHASGICYTDVHLTLGHFPGPPFPRILGHEPVGEIVAVAPDAITRNAADRAGAPMIKILKSLISQSLSAPLETGRSRGFHPDVTHGERMLNTYFLSPSRRHGRRYIRTPQRIR